MNVSIGVLASGRGSNFRSLAQADRRLALGGGRIVVLACDTPGAGALSVAREFGIEAVVVEPKAYPDRAAHEAAVAAELERRGVGLVCLAGWMRLLSPAFLSRFPGRVLNIHPALLPSFPGLHAPRQALAHGAKISGATVHFADEGCDTGPIVLQVAVPILEDDTEETLSARILAEEHRIYPEAVRLFCEGRLKIEGRRVRILPAPAEARH